jgi:hypothetical protein
MRESQCRKHKNPSWPGLRHVCRVSGEFQTSFYADPADAVFKVLGVM